MLNKTCKRMRPGVVLPKGAWTAKEDMLIRNCIEKFGDGKWHLVPLKAGLNRCRKSCRLRWLNYLRPNIKRGEFSEDEVDLMLRLHKLLGNRWSLIAGRIRGGSANDVKNYWNTHARSRSRKQKEEAKDVESSHATIVTVIKPQPQTFSKILNCCPPIIASHQKDVVDVAFNVSQGLISSSKVSGDKINEYLDEFFDDQEKDIDYEIGFHFAGFPGEGEALIGQNSSFNLPCVDNEIMLYLFELEQ